MGHNPRPWLQPPTRSPLALVAFLDTFTLGPTYEPLARSHGRDSHAVVIVPVEATTAALRLGVVFVSLPGRRFAVVYACGGAGIPFRINRCISLLNGRIIRTFLEGNVTSHFSAASLIGGISRFPCSLSSISTRTFADTVSYAFINVPIDVPDPAGRRSDRGGVGRLLRRIPRGYFRGPRRRTPRWTFRRIFRRTARRLFRGSG